MSFYASQIDLRWQMAPPANPSHEYDFIYSAIYHQSWP